MLTLRKNVLPAVLAVLLLSATACTSGSAAGSPPGGAADRFVEPNVDAPRLEPVAGVNARAVLDAFESRDLVGHLEALQKIADDNDGNRASGTSGYEESGRYVEEQLRAAGYTPVRQTFKYKGGGKNRKDVESFNIIAETGGSAGNTVVVGGHLDSVEEGPGINDNGSGVAAVLETAKWMKESGTTPANRVVFAFWGAEENDLDGSQHYVDELSKAEKNQIAAYLNVDMAASPNGLRSYHDGDGSDFGDAGPSGSDGIEDVFARYFKEVSLPAESTVFDGGSDYEPFLRAGIPVGGLFSGDVEKKSKAQVQSFGGTSGKVMDSCYHEACDTIKNTNADLLKEMAAALAYATASYAAPRG